MRKKPRKKKVKEPEVSLVPVDLHVKERPKVYASLIEHLEETGRMHQVEDAKMLRARTLYLQGRHVEEIVSELGLPASLIDRMALIHGWDDLRDKRLFNKWRKISGIASRLGIGINERHDRIAGTIETQMERMLIMNADGRVQLTPSDLRIMASTLQTTMNMRRTVRDVTGPAKESKVEISHHHDLDISGMERLADALNSAMGDGPERLIAAEKSKHVLKVAVGVDAITDDCSYEDNG